MKSHHLHTGHMTQMGDLIMRISEGPDRAAVYTTAKWAAPETAVPNVFAEKLAGQFRPKPEISPKQVGFLSRKRGFL